MSKKKSTKSVRLSLTVATLLVLSTASLSQIGSLGRRIDRSTAASSTIDAAQLMNDLRTLSADEMEGRTASRPSMQKARDFLERRFRETGIKPFGATYRQELPIKTLTESLQGVNFVGFVEGRKKPDKYIVVTAHYDHVGIVDGQIYNGADDNASGVAALLALAKVFAKRPADHSIIFAAVDAEERGLDGSRYFVEHPPVPLHSILLNVNMDMVSRNGRGELYAAGAFHYPHLRPILETAQKKAKVKLLLGHDDPKLGKDNWTNQSDHVAFHNAKIPFIYFGVEDHPDYHKPTDDFEKIEPGFFTRAVETILITVRLLDKAVVVGSR